MRAATAGAGRSWGPGQQPGPPAGSTGTVPGSGAVERRRAFWRARRRELEGPAPGTREPRRRREQPPRVRRRRRHRDAAANQNCHGACAQAAAAPSAASANVRHWQVAAGRARSESLAGYIKPISADSDGFGVGRTRTCVGLHSSLQQSSSLAGNFGVGSKLGALSQVRHSFPAPASSSPPCPDAHGRSALFRAPAPCA